MSAKGPEKKSHPCGKPLQSRFPKYHELFEASESPITAKPRSVCVECLIGKQKKPILFKVTEPSSVPCVECLIGKQKKPILFKVTVIIHVCVYYCRTYYKAVRGGGRRRVEDMCYERRRAESCVDESAHHALIDLDIRGESEIPEISARTSDASIVRTQSREIKLISTRHCLEYQRLS